MPHAEVVHRFSVHPSAEYKAYIKSRKWKNRRDRYYLNHLKMCFTCGSQRQVELHHITYSRLGCERDYDLMPLCVDCHYNLHCYADKHPDLTLREAGKKWLKMHGITRTTVYRLAYVT